MTTCCSRCHAPMSCAMTGALTRKVTGMTTGATTCDPPTACWCAALPHAPMPAQTADCLCPACLCRDLGVSLDLLGKSAAELRTWMAAFGEPAYRGAQLYKAIYAARRFDFTTMTDLPAPLRERLAAAARIALPEIYRRYTSADGAVRYLLMPIFRPGGMQSITFLDRESQDVWRYYSLTRTSKNASLLTAGYEASSINRAVAFYRYLAGIPTDKEPPASP